MEKIQNLISSTKLYQFLIPFFEDQLVDEVLINSTRFCVVYRSDGVIKTTDSFYNNEDSMIEDMQYFSYSQGVRLDPCCPINGGLFRTKNWDIRWHFVLPSVSVGGALLSFRRHRFDSLKISSFVDRRGEDRDLSICTSILESIFRGKEPLIVCGATGTGKTSLLYACLKTYLWNNRVTIIEQLREFPDECSGWVHLVEKTPNIDGYGGYKMETIFKEVLRLRPDNIVVGEIRGQEEMRVFFEALQSGHTGVYTTCHAGSPNQLESRLRYLGSQDDIKSVFEDTSVNLCITRSDRSYKIDGIYKFKHNTWIKLY